MASRDDPGDVYHVVGKYVTVKTMTSEGPRIIGLMEGSSLPGDIEPDSLAHLIRVGLVRRVGDPPPPDPGVVTPAAKLADAEARLAAAEAALKDARERVDQEREGVKKAQAAVDAEAEAARPPAKPAAPAKPAPPATGEQGKATGSEPRPGGRR